MSKKKTIHVGTISGRELLLKTSLGHQSHLSGTGAWKNVRRCKKTRRQEDHRSCREV